MLSQNEREAPEFGISATQVDDFLTQGYLVMDDFISHSKCDELRAQMDVLIEKHQASIPTLAFSSQDNSHSADDYFLNSADKIHFFLEPQALSKQGKLKKKLNKSINKVGHGLHVADLTFKQFSFDARFKRICQQLGFNKVGLLQSMYIFKQPSIGDKVSWHQDSTYLYVEDSDVIGLWFALEDSTLENGCLQVIPGPDTRPLKSRMIRTSSHSELVELNNQDWDKRQSEALEVKKGAMVILHGRLPHASGENRSKQSRHAYALHFIDTAKHYPKENWLQWPNGHVPEL